MANIRIRFTITSGNLETAHQCDCQKWIRHLAANGLKTDDLLSLYNGRLPSGKMFVLDMLMFLRKNDPHLDRFLANRGGIKQDDLLSMETDEVRQLLKKEFPELMDQFANSPAVKKVVKRRTAKADLSPLAELNKGRG
jgi:hypothetical protein